jgi:hypothetical protein
MTISRIPNQRAIIDRRALGEAIALAVEESGGPAARP